MLGFNLINFNENEAEEVKIEENPYSFQNRVVNI